MIHRILDRTSQRFKIDLSYILKGGFWLSITQMIALIANVILAVAFANLVSPETYGQYRFVIAMAAMLSMLTFTGMGTSIIQAVSKGLEGSLREGVRTNLIWSLGMVAASLIIAIYYYLNDNYYLTLAFIIIAFANPIISSFSLYLSFLNGKKDFRRDTIFASIRKVVLVTVITLVLITTENPLYIIFAYFLSEAFFSSLFYLLTLKYYRPNTATDLSTLNFSKHLSFINIFKKLGENLDKVLIFQQLNAGQLAMYTFACAPIIEIGGLERILANLALPKLSQRSFIEIKRTLPRKVLLLTLLTIPIIVTYIAMAPYLFSILFPQYISAVPYSQFYALILIFTPGLLFNSALTAHKKLKVLYILKIVPPIIKIIAILILLPFYQIWGVLIGLFIFQGFKYILLIYFFYKS